MFELDGLESVGLIEPGRSASGGSARIRAGASLHGQAARRRFRLPPVAPERGDAW